MVRKIYFSIISILVITSVWVKPIVTEKFFYPDFKPQTIAPVLPNCTTRTASMDVPSPGIPIGDGGLLFTSLPLSNADPYLWDLDAITYITHPANSGLDITLTSPQGTKIILSSGNGGDNSNVFNGTRWDEQAGTAVTDYVFSNGVVATNLVPEEAMGAFIGENPNGSWSLDIVDRLDGYTGYFVRLTLIFTVCSAAPTVDSLETIKPVYITPVVIPDNDSNGLVSKLLVPANIYGPIYDLIWKQVLLIPIMKI